MRYHVRDVHLTPSHLPALRSGNNPVGHSSIQEKLLAGGHRARNRLGEEQKCTFIPFAIMNSLGGQVMRDKLAGWRMLGRAANGFQVRMWVKSPKTDRGR